jgi:Integrase core domain/zinc-finger of transposase IS204/IS1001/IS1096/IS1165
MQRPAPPRPRSSSQTWRTLIENHVCETLACDFFVALTATFRLVYVFLVMEIGRRRIVHWNVTEHPTSEWTVQQFRGFLTGENPYRFVVHDRDPVLSPAVDDALTAMNLHVLRTPARVPQANAFCERLIGTARRECLDHLIPLHERHVRKILAEWVPHYNRGRPHASLGPGIPEPPTLIVSRSDKLRSTVWSRRDCTWILGLSGFRVVTIDEAEDSRLRMRIERRGVRRYACSRCGRHTGRVRSTRDRAWDDLPWGVHQVTVVYSQRRIVCRTCGIRTERIEFPTQRRASPDACGRCRSRTILCRNRSSLQRSRPLTRRGDRS